jgi:acetyl-CoA acetyltransferase
MKLKAIEAEIGPQEVERRFVEIFPFNTHGGLMHFAAPWECPAAYNVIECVRQLRSECDNESKQIKFKSQDRLAIVTGNGGVFSSAAVLVLSKKFEKLSKL